MEQPAAPSPTETNGALAAIKAAMRAAATRISEWRIIPESITDPPRRPLDQRYQSQGARGRGRLLFLGHDDTAPRSDTTRMAAHTTTQGEGRDPNEDPPFPAVIGLLAYVSCVVIGLLNEFDHTVGGWNAAARVSYGLLVLLTTSLLGFGVMASVAGTRTMLWISDLSARLGAILCTALLVVAFSCKMAKPWGCAAGVPFAAVVAGAMGAIGIWGRAHALWDRVVGPRRQGQPPGSGDENV